MNSAAPRFAAALLSALVWTGSARAAEPSPGQGAAPAAKPEPAKPEPARRPQLDELFDRLRTAKTDEEAKGVANLIERRLERSGSDTADLLMQRSAEALRADDAALAVELLDRVTQLRPNLAEAWNRRAVAFFKLDDPARAVMDLEEALSREPRHFGAWAALGHVETANGDKRRALAAYRRALGLYPLMEDIRKAVDRLAPEIDGRDL